MIGVGIIFCHCNFKGQMWKKKLETTYADDKI